MHSVASSIAVDGSDRLPCSPTDATDEICTIASNFYSTQPTFLWGGTGDAAADRESFQVSNGDVVGGSISRERSLVNGSAFKYPDSPATYLDMRSKHFSYYTTEADKLLKHLDQHGLHHESYNQRAFQAWSPICTPVITMPSIDVAAVDHLAASVLPVAGSAASATSDEAERPVAAKSPYVQEKLSYSDVLTKSPTVKHRQSSSAVRLKVAKPSEKVAKPRSTTFGVFGKDENHVDTNGGPVSNVKLCKESHSNGKCHKSDNDANSVRSERLDEAKFVCSHQKAHKHAGNATPPELESAPAKRDTSVEKHSTAPTAGINNQVPKAPLNNLQNTQKACSQKRPLNFNNNLSSDWQDTKYSSQFKPKVKNIKHNTPSEETPPTQRKNLAENEAKKPVHRKPVTTHSEKSTKESHKKFSMKKKQKTSENIDKLWGTFSVHMNCCAYFVGLCLRWLIDLVLDVCNRSIKLLWQLCQEGWNFWLQNYKIVWMKVSYYPEKLVVYLFGKYYKPSQPSSSDHSKTEPNISLPTTREAAMKRILSCKGKDPYSILGVTPLASDEDIKKYYRRQAFLVHPDKNPTPGTEEAFKVLAQAFELIGEPEKRQKYDYKMMESQQLEADMKHWEEFSELINKLREKVEEAANTIRCTRCGCRHQRIKVDRPCYSARYCSTCGYHAARDGDIWAETSYLGFLWHYYACMDNAIYDVTEWAKCQFENLQHLKANHHNVQYRIISSKRSSSENIPRGPDFEDLLSAFQGKKFAAPTNNNTQSSKTDNGKKKKSKKKR